MMRSRMRACFAGLGLVIIFITGCAAHRRPGVAPGVWKTFSSTEGAFSVLMPGTPLHQATENATPVGPVTIHTYKLIRAAVPDGYSVSVSRLPVSIPVDQADTVLGNAVKGARNKRDQLLRAKNISLDGHPGREISVRRKDIQAGMMTNRFYLVKNRLYQVMAVTTQADASSPKVRKFLDSFKLID